jgi:hypothetical protein
VHEAKVQALDEQHNDSSNYYSAKTNQGTVVSEKQKIVVSGLAA